MSGRLDVVGWFLPSNLPFTLIQQTFCKPFPGNRGRLHKESVLDRRNGLCEGQEGRNRLERRLHGIG